MRTLKMIIEPEKKYVVKFDDDTISISGQDEIIRFIASQDLRSDLWAKYLPENHDPFWIGKRWLPELPDNWKWSRNHIPSDKRNPIRGFFTKRVEQYYRTYYGFKNLPPSFLEQIGVLVDRYVSLQSKFIIRLSANLDWEAGDYGDGTSCFWKSKKIAKDYLEYIGAFAIQTFDIANELRGVGRCWCIPDFPEKGTYTLFNGYGYQDDSLRVISKVFSKLLDMEQKKVKLYNNGSATGDFWINSSTGSVVGSVESMLKIQEGSTVDFKFKLNSVGICAISGRHIFSGEKYFKYSGGVVLSIYEDRFTKCPLCGEKDKKSHMQSVTLSAHKSYDFPHEENQVFVCAECSRNTTKVWYDKRSDEFCLITDTVYLEDTNERVFLDWFLENGYVDYLTRKSYIDQKVQVGELEFYEGSYQHLVNLCGVWISRHFDKLKLRIKNIYSEDVENQIEFVQWLMEFSKPLNKFEDFIYLAKQLNATALSNEGMALALYAFTKGISS